MGGVNTKVIFATVVAAYTLSWFLPIFWRVDALGYEGARFAQETLEGGIKYFLSGKASDPDTIAEALLYIVAGSCNILFLGAALFVLFRPVWSYILAPFAVGSMLLWISSDVGIGYYLWLISGVSLFAFSLYLVQNRRKVALSRLFLGAWSFPIYAPILLIGGLRVLLLFQEGA